MPLIRDRVNDSVRASYGRSYSSASSSIYAAQAAGTTPTPAEQSAYAKAPAHSSHAAPPTGSHYRPLPSRGHYPPDILTAADYMDIADRPGHYRSRVFGNPGKVFTKIKTNTSPAASQGPSQLVTIASGAPSQVFGLSVSEVPRKLNGQMVSLVTCQWSHQPTDTNYSYVQIWVKGYHAVATPQLVASGSSPLTFTLDATNETISVLAVAVSASGTRAPISGAATAVLVLSPTSGAPPAPVVSQTLVQTSTGYQFQFNQEAGLLTNIIGGYNIYRNTVNNSSTASKIAYVKQSDINAGVYTFQDSNQPIGQTYFYWVSAVDIIGEESALTNAQSGTIVGVATYPMVKLTGFQILSNPDFEFGLAGIVGALSAGSWNVYDNNASGSVVHSLVSDNTVPNGTGQKLKIVELSVGVGPSPGLGGFYYATNLDGSSTANGVAGDGYHVGDTYFIDVVANIPVGYNINFASNSLGTGGSSQFLSPQAGTGNWAHYIVRVIIGSAPSSTNSFPFFYLTGVDGVTWYVGQVNVIDADQSHRHGGIVSAVGQDRTKFGHGVGISASGVGNLVHAGNVRTYLNSVPNWGHFGSPGFDFHVFGSGSAATGIIQKSGEAQWAVRDVSASGIDYNFQTGTVAAGTGNIMYSGTVVTQQPNNKSWGFYGTPSGGTTDVDILGSTGENAVFRTQVNGSGPWSRLDVNTVASGKTKAQFWGSATIHQENERANGTSLVQSDYGNNRMGLLGAPGVPLDVLHGAFAIRAQGAAPVINDNDTNSSGRSYSFVSGDSAGVMTFDDSTSGVSRWVLNSTPQTGFYGSPAGGVDIDVFPANNGLLRMRGSNPAFRVSNTAASGRDYDIDTGNNSAGWFEVIDRSSNVMRWNMDGSGNADFAAGTPATGIGAGGVAFSDLSANLKLKNVTNAVGSTSAPTTSSTSFATIPEMTFTVTTKGNKVILLFSSSITCNNPQFAQFQFFMDGVGQGANFLETSVNTAEQIISLQLILTPSAASHTFDVRWAVGGGALLKALGTARQMQLTELG